MDRWLDRLITQLRALPPGRQVVLAITATGSLLFFGWLSMGLAQPEYRTLYRGLDPAEAAKISDALQEQGIAYRSEAGGTALSVAAEQVHEARMRVAARGLPGGAATGLEIFDEPAFGVPDFVHRVNFMRATQGELARSIEALEPVERSRVQVVMPERRSVLARGRGRPSASVVLRLRPGRELSAPQVQAIVHLVASSVEGLETEAVTVVDGAGTLLAPLPDGLPRAFGSGGALGYQSRLEQELSQRIERILEKTVGAGGVVARVRAELDWTEQETTEETFDPDSQVARSEQRSNELESDGSAAGGVPGVAANLPGAGPAGGVEAAGGTSRETETINYEISKTVSRRHTPMGQVKRLSVAVLVDERPAGEGGQGGEPWEEASLGLLEALARQAVGFDEERGDVITVRSAPFHAEELLLPEDGGSLMDWFPLFSLLARGLLLLGALLLFARTVVSPLAQSLGEGEPAPVLPASVEDLEAQLAPGGPGSTAASALASHTTPNAEEGARALRNWLNQG